MYNYFSCRKSIEHHTKLTLKTLNFDSKLIGTLLTKLPKSPNWYTIDFVWLLLKTYDNQKLVPAGEDALFKLLKYIEVT